MTLILAVVYPAAKNEQQNGAKGPNFVHLLFVNAALGAVYSCPGFVNGLGGRSPDLSLLSPF